MVARNRVGLVVVVVVLQIQPQATAATAVLVAVVVLLLRPVVSAATAVCWAVVVQAKAVPAAVKAVGVVVAVDLMAPILRRKMVLLFFAGLRGTDMKKAWIENGIIRDVTQGDPNAIYHADVAAHYDTDVPDNAANGDAWNGTKLTKPAAPATTTPPPPAAPVPPKVTPPQFKLLLTSAERVALRLARAAGTNHVLEDFFDLIDDPRLTEVDLNLESNQNAVEYLLTIAGAMLEPPYTADVIAARKTAVLTGVLK